jgi:hypothetical protein
MSHQVLHLLWDKAADQHGVVSRAQLLELRVGAEQIKSWVVGGRLHPVARGVYAVGRPGLSRRGQWMSAILSCGVGAALDHHSAAALWEIRPDEPGKTITLSTPASTRRQRPGITVHRRPALAAHHTMRHRGIPGDDARADARRPCR